MRETRLSKAWVIAAKDFKIFRRKRNVLASIVAFPLVIAVLLAVVVTYAGHKNGATGIPAAELVTLLPAFSFFYLILAAYVPTPIASYTMVGEKVEKSLEPLLAAPITDSEILLGKTIAAFIPSMIAAVGGSIAFMGLMDLATRSTLGYYYFPTWNTAIIFAVMFPLAAIMSIEANVIVSSKINDVRTGQQLGVLTVIPLAGIYVSGELGLISLGTSDNLLIISAAILVADLILVYVAGATFRREEILTKWR